MLQGKRQIAGARRQFYFAQDLSFDFRHSTIDDSSASLPNHFDEHPFAALAVEFGVVDLLPWTEIQLAVGDGNHHLMSDDQILQV